jgi:hypothetical protein
MPPTPSLSKRAARAIIYANGSAARHRPSARKRKEAQKLVALCLIQEIRSKGGYVPRKIENALRGN